MEKSKFKKINDDWYEEKENRSRLDEYYLNEQTELPRPRKKQEKKKTKKSNHKHEYENIIIDDQKYQMILSGRRCVICGKIQRDYLIHL